MRRMHYMSFVSMFRSDLYEGLCVGHAPRKCAVCGKWFLTTDARYAKYCDGLAPGDKCGRTCRQVGNLRGREQRELAADHPIRKIYTKRFNTITQYLGRGTLDEQTAAVMKALTKSKLKRRCKTMTMRRAATPPKWSRRLCWQKRKRIGSGNQNPRWKRCRHGG